MNLRSPQASRRMGQTTLMVMCGVASVGLASKPALAAPLGAGEVSDPLQPINRAAFAVHQVIDTYLLRPAAMTYKHLMPRGVRTGLRNAVSNLGEPSVAVNDALQGHGVKAAKTLTRFVSNSTFGFLGLWDVATPAGLPHHANDFGVTLGRYGVGSGPYLFIPVIGPSTVRDVVGAVASFGLNPLTYARYPGDAEVGVTSVVAGGLGARAAADGDLKALQASATDVYASFRSYYLQNREAEIRGGELDIGALPDFNDPASPQETASPPPAAAPTPPAPSQP